MSAAPATAAGEARLPRTTLLVYALPSVALTFSLALFGLYFFKYATDVLGIAPALMGGLVAASRLWDGVSDPIAGTLSDRTRTRFGRRRPWIAAAALPFGASMIMLWGSPTGWSGPATALWVAVALFCFYASYTAISVPYGALGAELSPDYHDRTRIFAYRQGIGAFGLAGAIVGYYFFLESQRPDFGRHGLPTRTVALAVGSTAAVLSAATVAILVARIRERDEFQELARVPFVRAFRDVVANRHARPLLIVQCAYFFSLAGLSLGAAYLFDHVMQVPPEQGAGFAGCFAVGTLAGIPLWVRLARRFGKDRCWRVALAITGALYCGLFFVMGDPGALARPSVVAAAALYSFSLAFFSSSSFVLSHSMQADVIDADEVQSGERKEGAYLATWSFAEKCSAAIAAGVLGVGLEWVGYDPLAETQSEATRTAILAVMSWLPGLCHGLGALALLRYDLDAEAHARIREQLRERRGGL